MIRPVRQPFRIYRVGGSVRDELLGRSGGDRDWVVVGATPEMLAASGFRAVGSDFPVFLHPESKEEYALARTERKHGRGYRGFEFFASPEVTLEADLARRDLTINAMARDDAGRLIDPHGGEADLRAGMLRHVSPAFVEDPLRVLRVARFAARLGFAVAPETRKLMRTIARSGELTTLAPERVWQELARGLMEAHPARMLAVLDDAGALAAVLPEVAAAYPSRSAKASGQWMRLLRALDRAAAQDAPVEARYAVLAQDLAAGTDRPARARTRAADALSARLKVPTACRDAARLAARWLPRLASIERLPPAGILDLLQSADALRRPERLAVLMQAWIAVDPAADALAPRWRAAQDVVRRVALRDVARAHGHADAISKAVRAARLGALRQWKRSGAGTSADASTVSAVKRDTRRRASRPRRRASGA
ncbi:MAG TPA: multifunctional CCA tRNA nucleotidyl transferase/2'3'-cyclic phosphodiesterase/2'nucleotidase/phosphatase [Casimicrobiaceae bacterium]